MGRTLTIVERMHEGLQTFTLFSDTDSEWAKAEFDADRERVQERVCEFLGLPAPEALCREAHLAIEERNQARAECDKWKSEARVERESARTARLAICEALGGLGDAPHEKILSRIKEAGQVNVKLTNRVIGLAADHEALKSTALDAQCNLCFALAERNDARKERDKADTDLRAALGELGTVRAQYETATEQYAQKQKAERELQERATNNALFQRDDARIERDKARSECEALGVSLERNKITIERLTSERDEARRTSGEINFMTGELVTRADLVRQRDEARQVRDAWIRAHDTDLEAHRRVVGERDRALERVERLMSERDAQAQARDAIAASQARLCEQLAEMRKERDALKEKALDKLAKRAYENGEAKGFWEPQQGRNDRVAAVERMASKLALIHSEVSEALEVIRKNEVNNLSPHGISCTWLEEEIADVLIRCFDFAHAYGLGLDNAVALKMAYNESRPHKHGGKVI